jgi:ribosomal protein S18 acetylase RimI-like enzyme
MNLIFDCTLVALTAERPITSFDCGDADLNEFFVNEALLYQEQLLGQTYYFQHNQTNEIVCAYTLSSDGLKMADLPGSRQRKVRAGIPREKAMKAYPAFLIGRLGVSTAYRAQGIGSQLMEVIKNLCLMKYSMLGRFLLVDAYNQLPVLDFYQKHGFKIVFSTEEQECIYYRRKDVAPLSTRYMYYDLMSWKQKELQVPND